MGAERELQAWFEAVWTEREDRHYRQRFGDLGQGVFPAGDTPYARMKRPPAHDGWRHHGVFACPPHGDRRHWTYVTSGLSNPWNLTATGRDPSGWSGLGFELCLHLPDRADTAVQVLHNLMAWQLLVSTGAVTGQPLDAGQRVPLGGSLDGTPGGPFSWVVVEREGDGPAFDLPSGNVDLLMLVGVTEAEVAWARTRQHADLVAALRAQPGWPVTDAARPRVAG